MGFTNVVLLVITVSALCLYVLLTQKLEWESISIEDIALGRNIMSEPTYFTSIRIFITLMIWASIAFLYFDKVGLNIQVPVRGKIVPYHLVHSSRFTVFTVWCWVLQGVYFALATTITVLHHLNIDISSLVGSQGASVLGTVTWVFFELSFSVAYLVTFIVTFVLIPAAKHQGTPTQNFFRPMSLIMHNANVLFITFELLHNRLSFHPLHFPVVVLYGLTYTVFSWFWFARTGLFYYFFLDYDRPWAVLFHLGLLVVLAMFFFAGNLLAIMHERSIWGSIFVWGICFAIMKVRDTPSPTPSTASPPAGATEHDQRSAKKTS